MYIPMIMAVTTPWLTARAPVCNKLASTQRGTLMHTAPELGECHIALQNAAIDRT